MLIKKYGKIYALALALALALPTVSHMEPFSSMALVQAEENVDGNTDGNNDGTSDNTDDNSGTTDGDNQPEQDPVVKKTPVISGNSSFNYQYKSKKSFYLNQTSSGDGKLTYVSSNPSVASVSAAGLVVTKGIGTCTITVQSAETDAYLSASKTISLVVWKKAANLGYSRSYKKSKYYKRLFALKLYGSSRENLLSIAESQTGYHESSSRNSLSGSSKSSGNYTEYGRFYNENGVPWCAIFVNWVARENGIRYDIVPKECAVRFYYSFYQKKGLTRTWNQVRKKKYIPQKGDIIFYSYSYKATTHHIGYVRSCTISGSKIVLRVIEGNQKNAVRKIKMTLRTSNKTGAIRGMYITGFASPRY